MSSFCLRALFFFILHTKALINSWQIIKRDTREAHAIVINIFRSISVTCRLLLAVSVLSNQTAPSISTSICAPHIFYISQFVIIYLLFVIDETVPRFSGILRKQAAEVAQRRQSDTTSQAAPGRDVERGNKLDVQIRQLNNSTR